MNILHLDASALGGGSATREMTAAIVADLRRRSPSAAVSYRDLDAEPLPHVTGATLGTPDARSDAELEAFLAADTVVVGAPMYNFGIPSTLKAWLDRISVAGRTFRYTPSGPVGLVPGKRVIVAIAAGGRHAGQPTDFVEPYLRQLFGFLGIDDVQFVRADGVSMSPEHRRKALDRALAPFRGSAARAA